METLLRPVIISTSSRPAATASSTTYWMSGLSTTGSISLGCALVAGRNRVPRPAAGRTALRTRRLFSVMVRFRNSSRTEEFTTCPLDRVERSRFFDEETTTYGQRPRVAGGPNCVCYHNETGEMPLMAARILGIESSCDETAAAVVADGREHLSNV